MFPSSKGNWRVIVRPLQVYPEEIGYLDPFQYSFGSGYGTKIWLPWWMACAMIQTEGMLPYSFSLLSHWFLIVLLIDTFTDLDWDLPFWKSFPVPFYCYLLPASEHLFSTAEVHLVLPSWSFLPALFLIVATCMWFFKIRDVSFYFVLILWIILFSFNALWNVFYYACFYSVSCLGPDWGGTHFVILLYNQTLF